ncbi:hypothetical protein GUI32_24475, partial [Escherichia coli]|nr:hypothetical protein [Escherichia coli]NAA09813.1 hypothetical protein [Escherichia coli]
GTVCVVGKIRDLILQLSKSSIYSTKPHSGYTITREDLLVAATLLAQNLFTHGYALGKL